MPVTICAYTCQVILDRLVFRRKARMQKGRIERAIFCYGSEKTCRAARPIDRAYAGRVLRIALNALLSPSIENNFQR
jgi:hypothetical protein